jgi:hypothetical protein
MVAPCGDGGQHIFIFQTRSESKEVTVMKTRKNWTAVKWLTMVALLVLVLVGSSTAPVSAALTGWQTKEVCFTIGSSSWPCPGSQVTYCDKIKYYINGDGWVWLDKTQWRHISGSNWIDIDHTSYYPANKWWQAWQYELFGPHPNLYPGEQMALYHHEWKWFGNETYGTHSSEVYIDCCDFTPCEYGKGYTFPVR